tara:strand:+ start:108 stop:641 length:534 start_codon:yes stop_codon:yes gene_type:complete
MDVLYFSLNKYYTEKNIKKLNEILKNNQISLRIIDWFVTNYSKKNNIFYGIYKTNTGKITFNNENNEFVKQLNVFHSYKSQLKSFSKKKFDPFCRKNRIQFHNIETTIGQLNFFRWAIDNLIIDYIIQNFEIIEDDMNNFSSNFKIKESKRKKRQELSKSISRGLNYNKKSTIINFN